VNIDEMTDAEVDEIEAELRKRAKTGRRSWRAARSTAVATTPGRSRRVRS